MQQLNISQIKHELKIDAHALDIPTSSANIFIDRTITAALKKLQNHSIITETDLRNAISKELRKYHSDFAYVYQNRDKII
ncbi:hypothetical protein IKE82_01745 [Candidatus Saccharibacteria bacterium]|nr:hypothetical protein [Candidatus Saccharibacteria bacterium]